MSSSPLNVQLEQYEGPLDLLLDLIRKHKVDVRNIPIAKITNDYLAYMGRARQLDIELSAEFVYMAATLIHIKSRSLLPKDPALEESQTEDVGPQKERWQRLPEYERFKSAAQVLQQKRMIEENVWTHPHLSEFLDEEGPELQVSLFDLVKTLKTIMERAKERPIYEVTGEDVSVPEMIAHLRSVLLESPRGIGVRVGEVFAAQRSRRAMICLFLAILELLKRQAVRLGQNSEGELVVRRHHNFEEAAGDQVIEQVREEYQ